jgi:hypothetical protein
MKVNEIINRKVDIFVLFLDDINHYQTDLCLKIKDNLVYMNPRCCSSYIHGKSLDDYIVLSKKNGRYSFWIQNRSFTVTLFKEKNKKKMFLTG